MFLKLKLKKQIRKSKEKIAELEQRRSRSQAALVAALLKNEIPRDEEVDYFNHFSEKIDLEREHLHALTEEYEALLHR
jgi:hypothetical protein